MTSIEFKTPRKKRRRTCWDRLRARALESRRQRRTDPATSTAAQLLALFALVFGRMPLIPTAAVPAPYKPPPMSPRHACRLETSRRLGIPSRYVDIVLTRGTVPYEVLFDHVRRGGRSRQDAITVLRQRAPEPCRDWLDHVEQCGLWSSLLLCHVRGADEDTDVKLLKSTLAWLQDLNPGGGGLPPPADAGMDLTPGPGGAPDDDPKTPTP